MSFNKAKALKTASKYVQQGKYQSAIEEYRQIAQADPSDVTTLNTLGDLYVKVGQTTEAIDSFLHIAEHYRVSGFYLKSIAMLKKVSKLDPDNIEVALKLAGLYAQQKLIVDARHQYLSVAERYVRDGQSQEALTIYQKIADLDPENTSIQLKLADAYLRENQVDKAYDSFVLAAGELRRQGKEGEALQTYLRALKAHSHGQVALSSAVNLFLQRNEQPKAIELIEGLLSERPNDAELMTLLARVHQSTNNLEAAETAVNQMITIAPSRYQYSVDLALMFVRRNDVTGALRLFDGVIEILHEYREEEKAANLLREVLAQEPQNIGALTRLVVVYERTHDEHLLIETLNTIVTLALQQDDKTLALNSLRQLMQLEPDEILHRRRLREVEGDEPEAQPVYTNSYESDFATDSGMNSWNHGTENEFSFGSSEAEESAYSGSSSAAENSSANYQESQSANESQWGSWSAPGESNISQEVPAGSNLQAGGNKKSDATSWHDSTITAPEPEENNQPDFGSSDIGLSDELESVDFYLSQGMLDVARYTLESIAAKFPDHAEVAEKVTQLNEAEAKSAQSILQTENTPEPLEETAAPVELTSLTPSFEPEIAPVQSSFKDLADSLYAGHDLAAGDFMGSQSENSEGGKTIFLAEPETPASNLSLSPMTPAPLATFDSSPLNIGSEWQPQIETAPAPQHAGMDLFAGEEMDDLLGFLDDFKAETEQQETVEDYETHFNLGLAYKEMDMFDEAIEEFQQAFKAIMSDPIHANFVPCCNMLGYCFMQKGLPRLTIMWLKKALDAPGKSADAYQALRYDLADAYAATGELQFAYDTFAEVYAVDVQYRNVKTRMQEVSGQMS